MIDKRAIDRECNERLKLVPEGGPWNNEPNMLFFEHEGFECSVIRIPATLAWCGYVGVGKEHPYYRVYSDKLEGMLDVHGGVTYSELSEGKDGEVLHWIGFDCAHAYDICPNSLVVARAMLIDHVEMPDSTYKTIKYAINETKKLAKQLKDVRDENS